jgi:hypothetical protein
MHNPARDPKLSVGLGSRAGLKKLNFLDLICNRSWVDTTHTKILLYSVHLVPSYRTKCIVNLKSLWFLNYTGCATANDLKLYQTNIHVYISLS